MLMMTIEGFMTKAPAVLWFFARKVIHQMIVASKSLFETIKTPHEGKGYRLKKAVHFIRNSFGSEAIDALK